MSYCTLEPTPDTIVKDINQIVGGSMKIEHKKKFVINEIKLKTRALFPADELDNTANDFIRYCKGGELGKIGRVPDGCEIIVSVALCFLGENESWRDISPDIKNEGWFGASLIMWNLYTEYQKINPSETIILPGIRYRDDDFFEWVPFVNYSRKGTKVLMKPYTSLPYTKSRVFLISKIEILDI